MVEGDKKSFMNKRLLKLTTLKDVASKAGVSPGTVSRVLTNCHNARVSEATRKKIFSVAKRLQYKPNAMARGLRVRQSFALTMYVPNIGNPVFPEIIKGAEDAARERGYSLFLSHLDERTVQKKLYAQVVQEGRVDGLVMATALLEDEVVEELERLGLPFVMVNRRTMTASHYVAINDAAGARLAVEHLVCLGHRRIACLCGPLMFDTVLRRLQGYRQTLHEYDIPYDSSLVEECNWQSWTDGAEAMSRLLSRTRDFSAVFAGNLMSAVSALTFLRQAGYKVPGDVSLIGFHDAPFAEAIDPPLTVVKMPLYEMGRQAVSVLIDRLEGGDPPEQMMLEPLGLVVRGSTAEHSNPE